MREVKICDERIDCPEDLPGVNKDISCSANGFRITAADGRDACGWAAVLALAPVLIALALGADIAPQASLLGGLLVFGALFAVNSALHSYLIVSYAREDGVSLDVGFYYMANALGRLVGTVLSGWVFQVAGLLACLWISAVFVAAAALISSALPRHDMAERR